MKTSRHRLAGSLLVLAVLGGGLAPSLRAQSPGQGTPPPWAVPRSGSGGPGAAGSLEPGAIPGLPASESGSRAIQKQGDLLRLSRDVPGDAKPIVLEADEVFTWEDQGHVVFLLAGRVLAQQSVVQARCEQAVAWVDKARYKKTGILHVDLYTEGKVRLDTSFEIQDGGRAVLDLNTRGEFRVRGKVQNQPRPGEPIVARARGLNLGPQQAQAAPAAPQPPVVPTPAATTLPPVPGGLPPVPEPAVVPAGGAKPLPTGGVLPMSFNEPKPGPTDPASAGVVPAQAIEPAPAPGARPAPPLPVPTPSPDGYGPPDSVPPPGQDLPPPPRVKLPPPPVPLPAPTESRRQPAPEPPTDPLPPPQLPDPTPADGDEPLPLPPPSSVQEPKRPGELPKRSSPNRPLEHRLLQRTREPVNILKDDLPGGRSIITVTGGLILNIRNVPKIGVLDVEADRAVIWVKNRDKADEAMRELRSDQGTTSSELEFYMAGHVILRSKFNERDRADIEADEMYYDAKRNVMVALQSRLHLRSSRLGINRNVQIDDPIILATPELLRTGPNTFEVTDAHIFSSKLPSDPGLELIVARATLTNQERPRTFFGQPVLDKQGNPAVIQESIVRASNVFVELMGVPVFYTPYLVTDARDPLGPLDSIAVGMNNVMGAQFGLGVNVYKLFGVDPIDGTRFRLYGDYLSRRGPGVGTNFGYDGVFESLIDPNDPYEVRPYFDGFVKMYGIQDNATDILGGTRPPETLTFEPPGLRGRSIWRQGVFDLPGGFNVIAQMSLMSDRNFLEQYFKREFDNDPNQANFAYVKQQQDNWAWYALAQPRTSQWITTTQWLPRADAFLIGQDFFDLVTSNTQVSLAYADLRISSDPPQQLQGAPNPPGFPQAFFPTDQDNKTGRFALLQEWGVPLDLGAVKFIPYVKGSLVEYTNTLDNQEIGRVWGGVGARASMPLTRLYPNVESELFNLKGINHKMVFSANYFNAHTNEPFTRFAQLDRLNDDATAEALRDFKPQEPLYNRWAGVALATNPYYDAQTYAIRRLVDNRIETVDNIQVLQLDLRQRWQTKRGFPGYEHVTDWMVLDTSASYFPQPDRDNFGQSFSFLEYQYLWNIGDRTALESSGWYDPQDDGSRVFTIGSYFSRTDRTSFYVGYRQIDPLHSRMVMASVNYIFSPKYAMNAASSYDFGTNEAQNNTLIFTRTGSDLTVSLGISYNSLQNSYSGIVEIVPSLIPAGKRGAVGAGMSTLANNNNR